MKTMNKISILVLLATFMVACVDLDTFPEGDDLTLAQKQEVVNKMPQRLSAEINGMYSVMGEIWTVFGSASNRADDFGYPAVCLSADLNSADMVADNSSYNWFSVASSYEDRTYSYANPYIRWALFYKQIKQANDILATIPADTDNEMLLQYKGQALAARAFDYFNLVQMFQFTYKGNENQPAVPILTENMEGDPSNNPRATVQAVYDLIMSDLNEAITLLAGFQRANKAAIDQKVAYGIRARVNLVMQNWSAAAEDAAKAMEGYTLLSKADVSRPTFNNAAASSWMWSILMIPSIIKDELECWPAVYCSLTGMGYTTAVGCYKSINTLLWSKISATDVRKGWWVDADLKSPLIDDLSWPGYANQPIGPLVISDVKMKYLPYTNVKFGPYLSEIGNSDNASDWCIMRAEEMLLIGAEGLAMSGNITEAKTLLENFVKSNRDESYVCTATTAEQMQDEIWFQRRVELWGEGFAFNDAMRLKKNIVRFNSRVATNHPVAFQFNIASTDGWLLLRIPNREINSNAGIAEEDNNTGGTLPKSGNGDGLTDGVTD